MFNCFPTEWQRIVFRNYGLVPSENIAKALETSVETVEEQAVALGLGKVKYDPVWLKKGFVTIIRNNWDILLDEQIILLLDMSMGEYKKLLSEYDFLDVKLGGKPALEKVVYSSLTEEQKSATAKIRALVEQSYSPEQVKPFDFFNGAGDEIVLPDGDYAITDRYTSHYCADYGSALLDDELADYSEEYLKRLSATGVNGLWMHETLRNLAEFPFDPSASEGYEKRVKNLKKLTERCKKYGVNIYIYLNEPRSMPKEFFDKYPELKGHPTTDGGFCLCTSKPKVKEYLYNAVKSLAENVPLLKGVMTITMSENPTHCYSKPFGNNAVGNVDKLTTECPDCALRAPEEVAAEVNNIIAKALKDGNGYTKLIANLWGWADFMKWTDQMIFHGIELLDKDVEVLCVSEFSKKFKRGGVNSQVIDYSISVVGPSEITVKMLKYAKQKGYRIWSKVQVNNSWECSAVPFVPAYDLMVKHIENLKKLGIEGLMLGWSLGGFPGGALSLCSATCAKGKVDKKGWYGKAYGEQGKLVQKAVKGFSKAFSEYPFSINALYFGAQNLACANMYDLERDNRVSTMTCYAFDDYEFWSDPYGIDVYINQYQKLVDKWEKAFALVKDQTGNANFEELKRSAEGVLLINKATLNFAKFAKYKRDLANNKELIIAVIDDEFKVAVNTYNLMAKDAKIGYEITNHYFFNRQRVLEKLVNLTAIKEQLKA